MSYLILNGALYSSVSTNTAQTMDCTNPNYYIIQDYDINSDASFTADDIPF